jgi:hypothetical protein
MPKVIIDMTMSLDGFVAGPGDGKAYPLGLHGGMAIFDWYMSGPRKSGDPEILHPEPGVNQAVVDEMFAESGAFIFGRRTYEITNGWGGRHPVNGVPVSCSHTNHRRPRACRKGHRISRSSATASPAPSARLKPRLATSM